MPDQKSCLPGQAGMTIVEVAIAGVFICVLLLGLIQTFSGVSRGVHVSRAQTLATQFAQERIEILRKTSYYRIRVSSNITVAALSGDVGAEVYGDELNYPHASMRASGIDFHRYVYVEKVRKRAGSEEVEPIAWNASDAGLKRINARIAWRERGAWKVFHLVSLIQNPYRAAAVSDFTGVVRDAATAALLPDAIIDVLQDPSLTAVTNAAGTYTLGAQPGVYQLRASRAGYFPKTSATLTITSTMTSLTNDFLLTAMSSGSVAGAAWVRPRLVISRVSGQALSPANVTQEYVEIFNPTTWTWTIDGQIGLKFQRQAAQDAAPIPITIDYSPGGAAIAPGGFYLFADQSPININGTLVTADAVWATTVGAGCDLMAPVNDACFPYFDAGGGNYNVIPVGGSGVYDDGLAEGAGALALYWIAGASQIDAVGWKGGGSNNPAFYEGAAPAEPGGVQGMALNEIFYRKSTPAGGISVTLGPAYDAGDNSLDWSKTAGIFVPRSSAAGALPVTSGVPADGAFVFANDGLSSLAAAANAGSPPSALFTLTAIATGSWTVSATSGAYTVSFTTTVTAMSLGNATVHLTSAASGGYVTGRVMNINGVPLTGITMSPAGVTDASGMYRLNLPEGSHTITANAGSANPSYVESSQLASVTAGQIVSGVNFYLSQGARLRGRVTTDGVNPLPDTVVAVNNNATSQVQDHTITDTNGYFSIVVPTGSYAVVPTVEYGETSSPDVTTVSALTSGATVFTSTFTIVSVYGNISGSAALGGESILTGALIVASTGTIPANLPDVTSTLRNSSPIYYLTMSRADGTFALRLRNGNYNLAGFYTTAVGSTCTYSRADQANVAVTAGGTTSGITLSW